MIFLLMNIYLMKKIRQKDLFVYKIQIYVFTRNKNLFNMGCKNKICNFI